MYPLRTKRPKLDSSREKKITEIADKILVQNRQSLIAVLNDTIGSSSPAPETGADHSSSLLSEDNIATLRKARELRLQVSSQGEKKRSSAKMSPTLTVSFCKMERSQKKGLRKADDYVEVSLTGDENYDLCVQKAITCLDIEYDEDEYTPHICRLSGSKVLDQPIIVEGKELPWTVQRYVTSVFRRSTAKKLGIALLEKQPEYVSHSDHSKHTQVQIWYAPMLGEAGSELDMREMKTRDELWKELKNLPVSKMNNPIPWYPESAGYEVCKIRDGEVDMLVYDESGFVVHQDKEPFCIVHQSKDRAMHLSESVVPLYCIASKHSSTYQYTWDNLHGNIGIVSPVVYVNKVGVYRCTVVDTSTRKCYSKSINISEASASVTIPSDVTVSTQCSQPSSTVGSEHHVASSEASMKHSGAIREFMKIEVERATGSFKELIGKGGFGKVYRGSFHGVDVAVKVFHAERENDPGMPSLATEVDNLSRFRHPNLITLMGYCVDPQALIYPYMENLSVYHCLHQFKVENPLSWERRINILYGTACGLTYLHSSDPPFIHQDIKSHNVLLDSSFNPKVCDFGFVTAINTHIGSTSIVTAAGAIGLAGTRGYTAPEYTDGKRGPKTDVYSYGVLCLETYTGLLAYCEQREEEKLVDHCQEEDMWKELSKFRAMGDLKVGIPSDQLAMVFMDVSQKCVQKNHRKRCNMDDVLTMWSPVLRTEPMCLLSTHH